MESKKPIDVYNNIIVPKIKEIDIFLKTSENMSYEEVAYILEISKDELKDILFKVNQNEINRRNFINIMLNGTSFICKMIKREIECGSPYFYNAKDLSYIYDLDYEKVLGAYKFLNLDRITEKQIPAILMQI
ncbi:hypothetical protein [uncultured Tyzzerella sp.]|uniref:hypothetical protein n=1 Tax=uncultured Tyzzerella sp. TaxID=2321398 RepID=UPI002943C2C6|nr:hypothetical protein [uncultured Tyzzerella sp.]